MRRMIGIAVVCVSAIVLLGAGVTYFERDMPEASVIVPRPVPVIKVREAFILWVDEYDHIRDFEPVYEHEIDAVIAAGNDDLIPLPIYSNSLLYNKAKAASRDEDPETAAEVLGLVQQARETPNVFASRFPFDRR